MPGINCSEYRVTFSDGTEKILVRENTIYVAQSVEDAANPIRQIQFVKGQINVELPQPPKPTFFSIAVTPQAAKDGHCKAAPGDYTVEEGTRVIFQALPAAGFRFDGWYTAEPVDPADTATFDPLLPVSTDLIAVIPVYQPGPGRTRIVEARFAPVP